MQNKPKSLHEASEDLRQALKELFREIGKATGLMRFFRWYRARVMKLMDWVERKLR